MTWRLLHQVASAEKCSMLPPTFGLVAPGDAFSADCWQALLADDGERAPQALSALGGATFYLRQVLHSKTPFCTMSARTDTC